MQDITYTEDGNPICPGCGSSFYTEEIVKSHYGHAHCAKKYVISAPSQAFEIFHFETQEDIDFYREHSNKNCNITAPGWYYKCWVNQPSCCNGVGVFFPIEELLLILQNEIDRVVADKAAVVNFINENITNV